MTTPDVPSLLSVLTRDRLVDIGRSVGVSVPARARKDRASLHAFSLLIPGKTVISSYRRSDP